MQQQLSELLRPTELADLIQSPDIIRGLERYGGSKVAAQYDLLRQAGLGKSSAAQILVKELDA